MLLIAAWMYSRKNVVNDDGSPKQQENEVYEVITPNIGGRAAETPTPTPSVTPAVAAPPAKPEKILTREEVESVRQVAKSQLAGMYTAQRSFHAEFDRYTTDLTAMGYAFDEGEINAKIGFLREYSPPDKIDELNENPENMNTDSLVASKAGEVPKNTYTDAASKISLDNLSGYCKRGCTANENEFEMLVAVPLGGGRVDVWLVNSKKEMELVQDGLEQR